MKYLKCLGLVLGLIPWLGLVGVLALFYATKAWVEAFEKTLKEGKDGNTKREA